MDYRLDVGDPQAELAEVNLCLLAGRCFEPHARHRCPLPGCPQRLQGALHLQIPADRERIQPLAFPDLGVRGKGRHERDSQRRHPRPRDPKHLDPHDLRICASISTRWKGVPAIAARAAPMAFVFLLTLLLTVLLPSNGSAEPVTVFGLGAKACGAFIDAKAQLSPDYRAFQSWVAGFLTGINRMLAADQLDMIQGVNFEAVEASIEQRCREHPAETFFAVAGAVAADLLIRSRPNP